MWSRGVNALWGVALVALPRQAPADPVSTATAGVPRSPPQRSRPRVGAVRGKNRRGPEYHRGRGVRSMAMRPMLLVCLAGVLVLSLGCEANKCEGEDGQNAVCLKSLKRFDGETLTQTADYTEGADVNVHDRNGNVQIVAGSAEDSVVATFHPFVLRAYDTAEDVVADDLTKLETSASTDADGSVTVDVSRMSGAESRLGADVTVELPPSFAGALGVDQDNGETRVKFVGSATSVDVKNGNGSCSLAAGAADVSMHCKNGDLSASIDVATPQTGQGFVTDNGSITLRLPADGVFSVQAQALDGGRVNVEHLPDACTVNAASDDSKTLSCNGATDADPIYTAKAAGTSLADVTLTF
jgi:hypothetical protein